MSKLSEEEHASVERLWELVQNNDKSALKKVILFKTTDDTVFETIINRWASMTKDEFVADFETLRDLLRLLEKQMNEWLSGASSIK